MQNTICLLASGFRWLAPSCRPGSFSCSNLRRLKLVGLSRSCAPHQNILQDYQSRLWAMYLEGNVLSVWLARGDGDGCNPLDLLELPMQIILHNPLAWGETVTVGLHRVDDLHLTQLVGGLELVFV